MLLDFLYGVYMNDACLKMLINANVRTFNAYV